MILKKLNKVVAVTQVVEASFRFRETGLINLRSTKFVGTNILLTLQLLAAGFESLLKILLLLKHKHLHGEYPYAEGKNFNMEYYENKHVPMVAGYLGSNLVRYTIEKGLASGIPGQPLRFMATGSFHVKSTAPRRDAIRADFKNYTDVVPVILVSEVVK